MSEKNTRLYELGFILVPTTPETEVSQKVEALKATITGAEGTVTSEGIPEFIDLAYTMEKTVGSKKSSYSQGYFGWIKFETAPAMLEVLKKAFDANAELVRYMMIKTDEANTISFKKPKIEAKRDTGFIDDEDLVDDSMEDEEVAAHEALPDLMPEIEAVEKTEVEEVA